MSSIPPNMNLAGSFAQTQVSADTSAKSQNTQRNKRARDAKELAKSAEKKQHEVENTEEAESLRVHREGEGDHAGQNPQDSYETAEQDDQAQLYHPSKPPTAPPPPSTEEPPDPPPSHIDFSA